MQDPFLDWQSIVRIVFKKTSVRYSVARPKTAKVMRYAIAKCLLLYYN